MSRTNYAESLKTFLPYFGNKSEALDILKEGFEDMYKGEWRYVLTVYLQESQQQHYPNS